MKTYKKMMSAISAGALCAALSACDPNEGKKEILIEDIIASAQKGKDKIYCFQAPANATVMGLIGAELREGETLGGEDLGTLQYRKLFSHTNPERTAQKLRAGDRVCIIDHNNDGYAGGKKYGIPTNWVKPTPYDQARAWKEKKDDYNAGRYGNK
jgi:hypothetical protein